MKTVEVDDEYDDVEDNTSEINVGWEGMRSNDGDCCGYGMCCCCDGCDSAGVVVVRDGGGGGMGETDPDL